MARAIAPLILQTILLEHVQLLEGVAQQPPVAVVASPLLLALPPQFHQLQHVVGWSHNRAPQEVAVLRPAVGRRFVPYPLPVGELGNLPQNVASILIGESVDVGNVVLIINGCARIKNEIQTLTTT